VLAKYAAQRQPAERATTLRQFLQCIRRISAVFGTRCRARLAQASVELETRTQQTSFEAMNLS